MKMKKMKLFGLMFLAGALLFSSCKKDEETAAPTISTSGASSIDLTVAQIAAGERVVFNINFTAAAEVETFSIKEDKSGTANATSVYDAANTDFSGKTEDVYNFDKTFVAADFDDGTNIYNKIVYTFTVSDKEGRAIDISYTVNVVEEATGFGAFSSYTTVLMGGQEHATLGSFYASSSNTVYLSAAAKTNAANVDFCYFYGVTNLATLCAPANADAATVFDSSTNGVATWSVRNATKFVASTIDFANLSETTDVSGVAFGAETKANSLAVGDVVAFQTVAGKLGFVKVTAITSNVQYDDGTITIEVKVQN